MEDRKVQVVLEDIRAKFRVFGESLQGVHKKLDSHTEMITQNTEDIAEIKLILVGHTTDIEIIKSDIAFIKNGLKKFVRTEEFEVLEKRVAFLENKFSHAR